MRSTRLFFFALLQNGIIERFFARGSVKKLRKRAKGKFVYEIATASKRSK